MSDQSFVQLLRARAQEVPEHCVYRFLADNGEDWSSLTYAELDRYARAGAALLTAKGRPGDRVVLAYPPGLDFIIGFFSCLYAGMVAVPVPLPDKEREARRLLAIIGNARPFAILSSGNLLKLQAQMAQVRLPGDPLLMTVSGIGATTGEEPAPRLPAPEELAFLQYTSGSVGLPKGVMVSHGNLIANERMIQRSFEHDESSTFVGWLPHFHDMGLIGNILQPLFIGALAVLMSPNAFVRDPLRWLELISRFRAKTSGAPNIAYELCAVRANRAKAPLSLDLSSWEIAFVGAEPVRMQTMLAFQRAFERYGFRGTSLFPCYGLAEATLFVSGGKKGHGVRAQVVPTEGTRPTKRGGLVGCGEPAAEQQLRIVNPTTDLPCAPGEEGEIWVAGPHVGVGYFGRSEETFHTFEARLPGDARQYLRTGDLGVMAEGQLVVTGRLKDLIIIHGQNVYPQDVEETVERAHRALRRGCSAAFALQSERGDQLAIVAEAVRAHAEDNWGAVIAAIRESLAREQELAASVVVLIPPQSIHKTSSGKIQRRSVRHALLDGSLEILAQSGAYVAPRPAAEGQQELQG